MKKTSIGALILLAGSAITLAAQNAGTSNTQVMGCRRGGAPYAWNDKNKDGICDLTGRPVGQGRGAAMAGQRMGRSRGGAPYAWNDKDKDGICDLTGRPVGQGRGAAMAGQGMGRGRGGAPYAWNDKNKDGICDITGQPVGQVRGAGRGYGRGFAARQQAQAPSTQK